MQVPVPLAAGPWPAVTPVVLVFLIWLPS